MGCVRKAFIDLKALAHNFSVIAKSTPHKKRMLMVKANAYGHGALHISTYLPDADAFGVACIEEALQLREAGLRKPIVLLEGFFKEIELADLIKWDLEVVIHHGFQVDLLSKHKFTTPITPIKVWIKINTGMHRLGIPFEQAIDTITQLQAIPHIQIQGLMTHFSSADELNNSKTKKQLALFLELQKKFPDLPVSLANSAAILQWPETHGDWVRPGLSLYGVSPFPNTVGADFNLKPVMQLESEIIAIQNLKRGDCVGYGEAFCAPEAMPIATVAIGYGDGYPRSLPNGTPVLVKGVQTGLVGRVSMDMISVDLRHISDPKIGDPVILWGKDLPVEKIAACASTIPYTLLTGLSSRVLFVTSK